MKIEMLWLMYRRCYEEVKIVKIYGTNQSKLNVYNNHIQKQLKEKESIKKEDQIEISNAAKKLQQSKKQPSPRKAYVEEIKQAVQSGEYKVDYEKTAKKMIDFWSKRG